MAPCTILVTSCNTWLPCWHRAFLVTENGQQVVYHKSPKLQNEYGGNIVRQCLEEYLSSRELVRQFPVDVDPLLVAAYSETRKEEKWSPLSNCEDFISEITTGQKGSTLRNMYVIGGGLLLGWLFCRNRSATAKKIGASA